MGKHTGENPLQPPSTLHRSTVLAACADMIRSCGLTLAELAEQMGQPLQAPPVVMLPTVRGPSTIRPRAEQAFEHVRDAGGLGIQELMAIMGLSMQATWGYLDELQRTGRIVRVRAVSQRSTRYFADTVLAQRWVDEHAQAASAKLLAKLGSAMHKPNQQTLIVQEMVPILLAPLPVARLKGLGGDFGKKVMEDLGCNTIGEVVQTPLARLQALYGDSDADWLFKLVRGVDGDTVEGKKGGREGGKGWRYTHKRSMQGWHSTHISHNRPFSFPFTSFQIGGWPSRCRAARHFMATIICGPWSRSTHGCGSSRGN